MMSSYTKAYVLATQAIEVHLQKEATENSLAIHQDIIRADAIRILETWAGETADDLEQLRNTASAMSKVDRDIYLQEWQPFWRNNAILMIIRNGVTPDLADLMINHIQSFK